MWVWLSPLLCSIANFSIAFADDLFLVSAATVNSFKVLKQSLVDFEKLSGLRPNLSKSNVYSSGVGTEECEILCNTMGLSKGMLPVNTWDSFLFPLSWVNQCLISWSKDFKIQQPRNWVMEEGCNLYNLCVVGYTYAGLMFSCYPNQ